MVRRWLAATATLLVVGALVELVLLGVVVWRIGLVWTLALLIVKAVVGVALTRHVGRRGWRQFRASVDARRPPGREATVAVVGLVGALLVAVAGFLGAAAGLVTLVGPVRRWVAGLVERTVERQLTVAAASGVFGPRRVKVRREDAAAEPGPVAEPAADPAPGARPAAIEGEILPPR